MTDTLGGATGGAKGGLSQVTRGEAVEHLKTELEGYLTVQAQRLLAGVGRKLGETTVKLNDIAEGNSPGLARLALDGGRKLIEGKGPLRALLETGVGRAKDSVAETLGNLTGGKSKRKRRAGNKPTVIMESIDVGVPLRTAYDQWTQYQDFSTFTKGVKSASRTDDITSDWQAKVLWSNRSWKATTIDQVADDRISWTSEGAKGTTKGVVSFHPLGDSLTRILLIIEYYPQGLFEKTGNLWRAQGRRARLDLKHFARFITFKNEAEEGWRGEIRDSEVVRTHEDALAEEESGEEEPADEHGAYEDEDEEPGDEEDRRRAYDDTEGYPEEEDEEEGEDAREDERSLR
ncbi:SRPBCC family protein [Streptomyces sp. RY43-2]|uniref:SRPBCC family protein n=1 Tax=Streptomyces macrolidinus TaxID=2952607 RepID=A0ABT0ZIR8_9ACTN|nr:SRPBCC family protein [Streptomyces macrolidinus]MCN9243479.1 SRPBCC family protein [Streptomyces macrolidinus]